MATINSITEKLQSRAPFLSVVRFKSGFSIVIKDQPFLLVECQKFLGTKIAQLTDDDIDNAIDAAIPTIEMLEKYKADLNELKTISMADMHKAYNNQNWATVGNLAFQLVGVNDQLNVLETASKYAKSK
jgi:hypothetical protein